MVVIQVSVAEPPEFIGGGELKVKVGIIGTEEHVPGLVHWLEPLQAEPPASGQEYVVAPGPNVQLLNRLELKMQTVDEAEQLAVCKQLALQVAWSA